MIAAMYGGAPMPDWSRPEQDPSTQDPFGPLREQLAALKKKVKVSAMLDADGKTLRLKISVDGQETVEIESTEGFNISTTVEV